MSNKSEKLREKILKIQDPVCFGIECPESIVVECHEEGDPCLACRTYRLLKLLSDMKMAFVDEERELPVISIEEADDWATERFHKGHSFNLQLVIDVADWQSAKMYEAGWRYVEKLEVKA